MDRVLDYLAMGGYARFVWPAYGVATVVLVGLLVQSLRASRARSRELAQLETARGKR
jgi:heme exporter protein D